MATKFRPVRGTDEVINQKEYSEGYVYFATDTGKIYLDANNERTVMGGSGASLFYASALSVTENPEGTYSLSWDSLDDSSARPKEDDLIINVDGSFYRVLASDDDGIECTLLAVSGTGSGSGSGGGESGGGTGAAITLSLVGDFPMTFIYQQDANVTFLANATMDTLVTYTVKVTGSSSATYTYTAYSGQEYSINIGQLLYSGTNKITVTATGENSGSATKSYSSRQSITLALQSSADFNPLQVFSKAKPCTFACMPVGGIEKTLRIYVDGILTVSETVAASINSRTYQVSIPEQTHGAHDIEAVLSANVNGVEVKADSLTYELAWEEDGNTSPIVWIPNGYESSVVNYTDVTLQYMVYDPTADVCETHFYREGVELATSPQNLAYSSTSYLKWTITDYEVGANTYTISVGSSLKQITLYVEEDTSRDMNIITSGLVLNLDSSGRSNNENKTSRQTWEYTNSSDIKTSTTFNNFNWYNNGWITDSEGKSCLRISNGASISIPVTQLSGILNSKVLNTSLAFEFRFKVRNVKEYATLISRTGDADAEDTIASMETNVGVFGKLYGAMGFCLGTQEAYFASQDKVVSARYREDETINLTFVLEAPSAQNNYPLMYIYLNGIMSGISSYNSSSDSFISNANAITFNSDYCDVDLYKLRIYKATLSSADVVHNYIADIKDVNQYDMNQIVSYQNNLPIIDYNLMLEYNVQHPSSPIMPYAVVKTVDADDKLPYVKGGKKAVSVSFRNPTLDYMYENGLISDLDYITSCPSYDYYSTGKSLDVQGTSSQGYPRRNFKFKAKQDGAEWTYTNGPCAGQSLMDGVEIDDKTYKYWYMDNKGIGESTFCWKADYMDSSRAHNSGFASYVSSLYSKHPLQDYGVSDVTGLRTTVYGFPMIVFQEKQDGSIEFVGMYNYNLDKGCKDTYGFTNGGESFVKDSEGNNLTFKKTAECWEFTNNQGLRCSFTKTDFEETNDTYTKATLSSITYEPDIYYTSSNGNYVLATGEFNENETYYSRVIGPLTVNNDFEYRYSASADDIDDCLDGAGDFASMSQSDRNEWMLEKYKNLREVCDWIKSTENDKAKFRNEFALHFDPEYCYIYFITTELLHCYDSRGKNLMLATWGPQKEGGNYIWYPIYYDIDTQLGINNSGVPTWDYNVEPTEANLFSTSNSVLWANLWSEFGDQIKAKYASMRKNNLDIEHLNGYYNFDPEVSKSIAMQGKRPIVLTNVDEYYKYIAPTFTGFINTSGVLTYDSGSFFYCLQGTRELMRYLYLRNRINYVDSKWYGGPYETTAAKTEFWARMDGSYGAATSDRFLYNPELAGQTYTDDAGIEYTYTDTYPVALDATPNFEVRSYLQQYIHGQYDETHTSPVKCDGKTSVTINANDDLLQKYKDTANVTQQLVYFGGGEYIADMGDLGLKYLDELHIPTLKRLESLKVGSDVEGYFNDQLNSNNFSLTDSAYTASGEVNENAKSLLKEVVLTGLRKMDGSIDVTGSEKLESFRALNTSITGVTLADGVQIKTLHLPSTVTTLSLTEPIALTKIIESQKPAASDEGLFIEGLTNESGDTDLTNIETKINTINVIGGNLGYGSYKLLKTATDIKKAMQQKEQVSDGYTKALSINLEDVVWSPYTAVQYGEPYDSGKSYWYDDGRYTLTANYKPSGDSWDTDTLNGKVYEYTAGLEFNTIQTLDLFKTYIDSYKTAYEKYEADGDRSLNYFQNTSATASAPTIPNITGIVYVDNNSGDAYDEADIQNEYLTYFPNLTIFCGKVKEGYLAQFVTVADNGAETIVETQRISTSVSDAKVALPQVTPTRINYDFIGWANASGRVLTDEEIQECAFSDTITKYVFYAVFEKHRYTTSYCDTQGNVLTTVETVYGERLTAPSLLPVTDESSLGDYERYRFVGWVVDQSDCFQKSISAANNVVVDIESITAQNVNRVFYACFVLEDPRLSATDDKYFSFNLTTYSDGSDSSYNFANGAGYQVAPAAGYQLQGKITIPATYNGLPVISVVGFDNQENLTHIFWYGTPQLRLIGASAFQDCRKLVYYQFTSGLRQIGQSAFSGDSALKTFEFPQTLAVIDQYAFNGALQSDTQVEQLLIPGEVNTVGQFAFAYLNNLANGIKLLSIGDSAHSSKLSTIGRNAFSQNTGTPIQDVVTYGLSESMKQYFNDSEYINYTGTISHL